jgi:hypothetical protein
MVSSAAVYATAADGEGVRAGLESADTCLAGLVICVLPKTLRVAGLR